MNLLRTVVVLRVAQVAVKVGGLRAGRPAARLVAGLARAERTPPDEMAAVVVEAAARGPRRPACLPRALTLQALLCRSGRPAELRIGVRRAGDGSVLAHAWVELEGRPLGEDPMRDDFEELVPHGP